MRLLHELAKTHASFDDPNLVSRAGLVPVMALAERAGLAALVGEHVRIGRRCGVNAELNLYLLLTGGYQLTPPDRPTGKAAATHIPPPPASCPPRPGHHPA